MAQLGRQGNWRFASHRHRVRRKCNARLNLMTYTPVELYHAERTGDLVVICDHATNTVPRAVNNGALGLPAADMERHIAYDIGAAGVTRALADLLQCAAVLSNFSRLVIDPNRGEDDPTLLMRLYDGSIIPANRNADAQAREHRMNLCYRPYHTALEDVLAARPDPILISIHSFTPKLRGRSARPWEIGILSAYDRRLSDVILNRLNAETDFCIGDNQPYSGHLSGDTVERHALNHGRHNTLIELRNDLISSPEDQMIWAARLAPLIADSVADIKGQING